MVKLGNSNAQDFHHAIGDFARATMRTKLRLAAMEQALGGFIDEESTFG